MRQSGVKAGNFAVELQKKLNYFKKIYISIVIFGVRLRLCAFFERQMIGS